MTPSSITEHELHAYIDGQLPPERIADVEGYLRDHPEQARRILAYRHQTDSLQQMFEPMLEESIPDRFHRPQRNPLALNGRWSLAASIMLSVSTGILIGWLLRDAWTQPTGAGDIAEFNTANNATTHNTAALNLARRAAIAHAVYSPDMRHPVEINANHEDQLVTWLSNRLGVALTPPKLSTLGYTLIGGRLLPGNEGPVAQFMYHNAAGKRVTLYITHEAKDNKTTAFQFAQEGPIGVFFWIDRGFGYAISAGADQQELGRIAVAVYDQLPIKQ
ncbi:MAG: anti-sigma factor family protein [Halothiobacillus sp.]